jgi:hypothetical protein
MIKPRHIAASAIAVMAVMAGPVMAQDQGASIPLSALEGIADMPDPQGRYLRVVYALDREGYTIVSVRQTMLNRALIRARNTSHLREVVISRASGNVLRDVIIEDFSGQGGMVPLDQILQNFDGQIRVLPGN